MGEQFQLKAIHCVVSYMHNVCVEAHTAGAENTAEYLNINEPLIQQQLCDESVSLTEQRFTWTPLIISSVTQTAESTGCDTGLSVWVRISCFCVSLVSCSSASHQHVVFNTNSFCQWIVSVQIGPAERLISENQNWCCDLDRFYLL